MLKNMYHLLIERNDFFIKLLIEHLRISMVAIVIAIAAGMLIGIIISEYQKISKLTLGVIHFTYTLPSISLLGFLIPFSGIGNTTAIIALTVYALLPIVTNTYTGFQNIDPQVLEAAKAMGSTRMQILYKIKLPLAIPVIMSGIRNMVTMTIALAGISSFIGAGGLGVAIYRGITTNNASMTMVGSLLIALLAILMDVLLGALEKMLSSHRKVSKANKTLMGIVIAALSFTIIINAVSNTRSYHTIQIATKPMTEQYIIGEMLDILIEQDTDLNVKLTQGVGGGTSNIQPGMVKGDFDIYPEYTGTGWNMVLKREDFYSEDLFSELQQGYEKDYDMTWIGMYGFNNTYGLAVRTELADQYGLKNYSDLAKISDKLTFGAQYDYFEREDGYNSLCNKYGFKFKNTIDLDIGLKYQAITQKRIDVIVVFTTDGQLSTEGITVLTDDLGFHPSYLCGNVIRKEVLLAHPELENIFKKLEGKITDDIMAKMNYQVETLGKEPRDVAMDYLETNGFLGKGKE